MLNFYYCPACNYPVKLGTFHDLNKTRVCFKCKKKIIFVEKKITFHLLPRAVRTARLSAIP